MTGDELNRWRMGSYKVGQFVVCTIVQQIHGGYNVTLDKDGLPGFLPSTREHALGDQVKAAFVCVNDGRMLLTDSFTFEAEGSDPKFPLLPIDGTSEGEKSAESTEPNIDDFV